MLFLAEIWKQHPVGKQKFLTLLIPSVTWGNILIPLVLEKSWLYLNLTFHPVSHYIRIFPWRKNHPLALQNAQQYQISMDRNLSNPTNALLEALWHLFAATICQGPPTQSHQAFYQLLLMQYQQRHTDCSLILKEPFQNFFFEKAAGTEFDSLPREINLKG